MEGVSSCSGCLPDEISAFTSRTACGRGLHLLCYLDQLGEGGRLEAGSSDQSTICRSEKLLEVLPNEVMCLLYLLIRGIHPRPNGPYRFIGDNELRAIGEPDVAEGGIQLPEHDLLDLARIALFQCLSNAQYGNQGP